MFDGVSQNLEKYLDLVAERQKLVTVNVANADTPGYRTRDIDFQFEFETIEKGERPHVIDVPNLKVKNDGNDVNLDREARLMAENTLRFNLASSFIKNQIKTVRSAIQEGGK